jgi:hypothetical protein
VAAAHTGDSRHALLAALATAADALARLDSQAVLQDGCALVSLTPKPPAGSPRVVLDGEKTAHLHCSRTTRGAMSHFQKEVVHADQENCVAVDARRR